jgi:hypothetical protein
MVATDSQLTTCMNWLLLSASQFGFRARHSTTLQCMRLTDHVTLNFNNNMSTAAVFLDIEKAFDTTWHPGLLYKLSELKVLASLIKLIASFLSNRKFSLSRRQAFFAQENSGRGAPRFCPVSSIVQPIHKRCPRCTRNSTYSVCRRYVYICIRETRTSCS